MPNTDRSSQDSALLPANSVIKPYNPATQHRVVSENMPALDMINERFARYFRMDLFGLLRRGADVTVSALRYQSTIELEADLTDRMSLNMVSMKPLRGNALIAFDSETVFMVVDHLFGGDGKKPRDASQREFSPVESRIIRRMLNLAMDAYQRAWHSILKVEVDFVRTETQVKFTNITTSSNDMVINTSFNLDVGTFSGIFSVVLPYPMLEPVKTQLSNMFHDQTPQEQELWDLRLSNELKGSEIELVTDFVYIDTTIGQLMALNVGDILPIEKPDLVTSRVQGVPVMKSEYGNLPDNTTGLVVKELINHRLLNAKPDSRFVKGIAQEIKEQV